MTQTPRTQKPPFYFGLIAIAAGILPVALGLEPTPGTPVWVLYAACSVFVFAGLAILFPSMAPLFGPAIILIFAVIATWIGFAPGERQCAGSLSLPFLGTKETAGGCGAFRVAAVIMWLIVLGTAFAGIKSYKGKRPKD